LYLLDRRMGGSHGGEERNLSCLKSETGSSARNEETLPANFSGMVLNY